MCNVYACVAGNNFIIVFTISAYIYSLGRATENSCSGTEQKVVDLGVSGAYSRSR